ncbi:MULTISPECIES: long-chain fatty acid--CoA ligase [unclassified Mycobacterium]|uniref:AMP-dependent synthetase/ligase n=1 Tax=unclassified Mycobacterium TaxID=2642494 RepID=UPI00068D0022|nr:MULTISPECIES: long-chain fatty acid--CoA ligase [unclassified Mycobacterium]SEA61508.1 Long-chain acyl-CoA synthetase (AMP-forming) [Mycobacterium sp. 283mftsu]
MTVDGSVAPAKVIDQLEVSSLCEAFQRSAGADPDAVALRTAGGEVEITWREYAARVESLARGLAALGVGRGDTVALLMTNRPEFHIVDVAAMHLGATVFSIYNTLTADQIRHLYTNAGNRVVICEAQYVDVVRAAADGTGVEHVICIDGAPEGAASIEDIEATGDADLDFEASWRSVEPGDVLTLIYTSGTTGPPKGVELTHGNILACMRSARAMGVTPGARLISYLPSAHAADRFYGHYLGLVYGSQITSVADARTVAAALAETHPTAWVAVPRIWEKLEVALRAKIAAESDPAHKQAMDWALDVGMKKVRAEQISFRGEGPGPDDTLLAEYAKAKESVLTPLRAAMGLDQVSWCMSGAAPIAPESLEFFLAIGVPICEFWGMSEMLGGTLNPPGRPRLGTIGPPMPGVELKLAEDGEILIRSDMVMKGYRGEPEKTAATYDAHGWLLTGDIGAIDDDGYVRIIDRKKDLIINAGGKNMSPANIENAIKGSCRLIDQAVAIGDRRPYNIALLTLAADALGGRPVDDPDVVADVRAGIDRANDRLARVEQIKRFRILPGEWEPGGDELTLTAKLKRKPIAEKYADLIEEIYEEAR